MGGSWGNSNIGFDYDRQEGEMVKGISIGMMVIIGLVVWWLAQRQEVQAVELLPGKTYWTYLKELEVFDNLEHNG